MGVVASPFSGEVVALDDVDDDVFAQRVVGDGLAVLPAAGEVVAPIAGRLAKLFEGGHGLAIEDDDGLQVLVHIGLETVKLKGDGFTVHVHEGDAVDVGQRLVTVDLERMNELSIDLTSPVVVISGHAVSKPAAGRVAPGDPLFEVE